MNEETEVALRAALAYTEQEVDRLRYRMTELDRELYNEGRRSAERAAEVALLRDRLTQREGPKP